KQTGTKRGKPAGRSGTPVRTARYDRIHGRGPRGGRSRGNGSGSPGRATDHQGGTGPSRHRPAPRRDAGGDHRGGPHAGSSLSRGAVDVLGDATAVRGADGHARPRACSLGDRGGLAFTLARRSRATV